jgi:hypothetical protein
MCRCPADGHIIADNIADNAIPKSEELVRIQVKNPRENVKSGEEW